jgi:hypothetical protein
MKIARNKTMAIMIAIILTISMTSSMILLPIAKAHSPAWQIPTQAYIIAAPDPVGVGQTAHIYMWLTAVFGAAGGTTAVIGTNASTASAALLGNNYRFHNYKLTITAPDGTNTTQNFDTISDTTSSQFTQFTPSQSGTYAFTFDFPGQAYAQYAHYEGSVLVNDTYLPSSASATLSVQQDPIPAATTSYPLPEAYWSHPIYGENTDWWAISSNWLGSGAGPTQGYGGTGNAALYHSDAVGPLTSHVMWTRTLQFGGVVGGNQFTAGGSNPNGAVPGAAYFEGSAYQPRFVNPIIMNGMLFYTEPASFTGPNSGPVDAVDLRTGQVLWSRSDLPPLSFGYIFNLWDPDQHGVYPPVLVAVNGANWQLYDAYTGEPLFNVTNIPASNSIAVSVPNTSPPSSVSFPNQVVSTNILGPNGEELRYVITNVGTATNPQWYLAQWNMSKLWQYDINPYTGGGSTSPDPINASNGVLVPNLPIPLLGENGFLPTGLTTFIPKGSTITVNANIPINSTTIGGTLSGHGTTIYDWNVSLPWLNTMPPPYASVSAVTGQLVQPPAGANPVSILAVNYGDVMLCRNGTLPTGFGATKAGYPQLPFTYFAVNLNASKGAIGSILWMKTYQPPADNITLQQSAVDFQTRVFIINELETVRFQAYSLDTGQPLWRTDPQIAWNYYADPGQPVTGTVAYGRFYADGFGGILYCYDDLTGHLLWTYGNGGAGNSTYAGLNVFYGEYPTQIQSIANGVVYTATDEHTIPNPMYKGAVATAINATDGTELWKLSLYPSEWQASAAPQWATADGFIVAMNGLDNNIYSIGRGPSTTSVTAQAFDTSIVIRGTVTDVSAGTKQAQQAANFPNGVPVSSDASMKDWMGNVYQQKPLPGNFTGVDVTVDVLDSNGNYRNIGTATTDETGMYSLTWTPDISGNFTVVATFHGTNGYWSSYSETTFAVAEPHPTVAPTAAPPASMTDTYVLGTGIAIIIVLIIIGAAILLTLRKRP